MSARQLRRAQEAKVSKVLSTQEDVEESDEEEEELFTAPKKKFNPFDLLSDDDDHKDAEDEDEDESSDAEPAPPPPPPPKPAPKAPPPKGGKKGGKKDSSKEPPPAPAEDEDELERALRELNLKPAGSIANADADANAAAPVVASSPAAQLLSVQPRFLNAAAELRRMFGSEALSGGASGSGGRKRMAPGLLASRGGAAKTLKKLIFVQPSGMWPRFDGSICMVPHPELSQPGRPVFVLRFSEGYQTASELFEQFSYDTASLEMVLNSCPYHIETLMAFYEMYSKFGEAEAAQDLLSRALFALELALSPLADLGQARCHAPYALPENRVLHQVFFAHMQSLVRAGCPRTALEVAKTLLVFDPTDPLGVLLQIDYICLRSNELGFLERLAAQDLTQQMIEGSRAVDAAAPRAAALALLPNMAYSLALARKRAEDQASAPRTAGDTTTSSSGGGGGAPPAPWEALAAWDSGSLSASEVLKRALLLHPAGLVQLLQRLEEKGFRKDGYWTSYLAKAPFAEAVGETGSASLDYLLSLFVERSSPLWRPDPVLHWVKKVVQSLVEGPDDGEPEACGIRASDWKQVRTQAFPDGARNIYSHVDREAMLEGQQVIPQEALQDQGPPPPNVPPPPRAPAPLPPQLQGANPLQAFLNTLLPWVNVGGEGEGAPEGRAGIGPEDYVYGSDSDEFEFDDDRNGH